MESWSSFADDYGRRVEYTDSTYSSSGYSGYTADSNRLPSGQGGYGGSYASSGYENNYSTERDAYADGYAPAPAGYDNRYPEPGSDGAGYQIYSRVLHQLLRPHHYRHHRPSFYSAYARAAHRYGFESGRFAGFAKRDNVVVKVRGLYDKNAEHEVPATSIQNGDTEYVVPVTVGNPGVTVNLDFDTGSSDLWIWSSELAGVSSLSSRHSIYDPRVSSTAQHVHGALWNISYGDGSSASGDVWLDTVTVAGVTVPNQAVECARTLSESFLRDGGNDGLLGLAWPAINTVAPYPVKTPVESMIEQGCISEPLFTVKLGHGKEPSFYSFGYIDHSVTSHPIHYAAVDNSQGFWQVASTSWTLNGAAYDRPGNSAILDTGTTLMLLDDDVVEAIYARIDGAVYDEQHGGWKYPPDAYIPDISFAIGDHYFVLNAVDFGFASAGDGYTLGGIQSRGDSDYDIFGDVFLKSLYVVFNQGEQTVGVAQRDD